MAAQAEAAGKGPMKSFVSTLLLVAVDPILAEFPIGGPLWSVVVPAILLALSVGATYLLYRRFADRPPGG